MTATPLRRAPRSFLASRRGFALPLVILIIVFVTVALAASFAAATSEAGSNTAQRGQSKAFTVAQSALELYLSARDSLCAAKRAGETCIADLGRDLSTATIKADSLRVNIGGGYAEVVAHQIRAELHDTLPATYFVRSRGVDVGNRVSGRDTTAAQRTVGVMTQYNTNVMNVLSAWTSLSGIQKNGTAGIVSGVDGCGKKPTVAGIAVPSGDFNKAGQWTAIGNPPADSTNTLEQLKARILIDWNAIINLNAIPADIEIPPQSFPPSTWFAADTSRWPVIRIHTNGYSLPNNGRGIIIADYDFLITGSNMWEGILLVGGKLSSNGNNTTSGATLSGLNLLLANAPKPPPSYVDDNATLNGQKDYEYNSCFVSRAAMRMKKFKAIPNTWTDDVPTW